MNQIKINLKDISMSFSDKSVFNSFSQNFEKHTVIKGASGIGKTTLLRILMGLQKPSSGTVTFTKNNKETKQSEITFSVVFQEDRLIEDLSAIDNIRLTSPNLTSKKISDELSKIGIDEDSCNKLVSTLSGGMKRRVAIVRAILKDSDVLLMDEPLKSLDTETSLSVVNYIKSSIGNRLFIVASHTDSFDSFCEILKI